MSQKEYKLVSIKGILSLLGIDVRIRMNLLDLIKTVQAILHRLIPNTPVWVFGSRINHTAKSYSDLDLVIVGQNRIQQGVYYQLKDAMEESDLPFKVDILDWHRISPSFRKIIQENYVVLG